MLLYTFVFLCFWSAGEGVVPEQADEVQENQVGGGGRTGAEEEGIASRQQVADGDTTKRRRERLKQNN